MSTSFAAPQRQHHHHHHNPARHSPAATPPIVPVSSPRSSTPTRTHTPRSSRQQPPPMSPSPAADPDSRSHTSTPNGARKRNHGRKRGDSRKPQPAAARDDTPAGSEVDTPAVDTEEDSEELFQLLGVNGDTITTVSAAEQQQPVKGLLRLSKEGMDAATKKNTRTRSKNKAAAVSSRTDTPVDLDSSDPEQHSGRQQRQPPLKADKGGPNTPKSSNKPSRARKGNKKTEAAASPADSSPEGMNMSSMSRSLPSSFFGEANKGGNNKAGDSSAWDMPTDSPAPGASQELNWQQQLAAETGTPSKPSNRSNAPNQTGRRAKATAVAPRQHERRISLDQMPVSNLTQMMAAAVAPSSVPSHAPVSAFDSYIPFHTGFNVHRAPQTPVRTGGHRSSPAPAPQLGGSPGVISLPNLGDFPRINKAGGLPLGGPKYAGPTFHNSPASGSLPKPDLDDF